MNDFASSSFSLVPARPRLLQYLKQRNISLDLHPRFLGPGVSKMAFSELLKAATAQGPDRKIPGAVVMAADASGSDR